MQKQQLLPLILTLSLFLLLSLSLNTQAQISSKGTPYTFKTKSPTLQNQKIPTIQTPTLDHKKIAEEDAQDAADNLPPRFGYTFEVNHNLQNSGTWTDLPNGDRIWRLQIHCPEAPSINLTYNDFNPYKGATITEPIEKIKTLSQNPTPIRLCGAKTNSKFF